MDRLSLKETLKFLHVDRSIKVMKHLDSCGDYCVDMQNKGKCLKFQFMQQFYDIDNKAAVCEFMTIFRGKEKDEK